MKRYRRPTTPAADARVEVVRFKGRPTMIVHVGQPLELVFDGALVWVKPVRGTTPEEIADYVEKIRARGAVRVLSMPLESGDAAVPLSVVAASVKASASVRRIVDEMLSEVRELRTEVTEIVEAAMSEAGA